MLLFLLCSLSVGAASSRVLFISSYHPAFPTFSAQVDGITETLQEQGVDCDTEYLDSKRFPGPDNAQLFLDYLSFKLHNLPPYDLIITGDDNALQVVLDAQDDLFAGLPVIFFGVNDVAFAREQDNDPLVTGFIESVSMDETLQLMARLHSGITAITAIVDETSSGQGDLVTFYQAAERFPSLGFSHISTGDQTWDELPGVLAALGADHAVLLLSAYGDRTGRTRSFEESLEVITRSPQVPIYHLWAHGIGQGLIGGDVVDPYRMGRQAALLALDVIEGNTAIASVPVNIQPENTYMFDYQQLKRHGISMERLPEGSELVNRPRSFYKTYRTYIWLTLSIFAILMIALLLAVLNILERRKTERALHEHKDQLKATIHAISEAFITTDSDGNVLLMNPVAERLLGMRAEEVAGRPFEQVVQLVRTEPISEIIHPVSDVLRDRNSVSVKTNLLLRNHLGREYHTALSCSPITIGEHAVTGVAVVIMDLTEASQMQEYMQRAAKLDSIGVLAGGIAHDFNNLLGGLFGCIEIARLHLYDDVKTAESYLDQTLSSYSRARDLTRQLLTFSKGGEPVRKTGCLTDVLKNSISMTMAGSNSTCVLSEGESLWLCDFDENQMGQVFDNLLINAKQAMPEGGQIHIAIENQRSVHSELNHPSDGEFLRICITDFGPGIAPERLATIFDPFVTTKDGGTGLGLTVCHSIITKHGGSIDVTSTVGSGSSFCILLPRSVSEMHAAVETASQDHHGHGTVFIMDDKPIMRDVLKRMLHSLGYETVAFASGDQLLEYPQIPSVRAMVLDLTIPDGLGGKEIVHECRAMYPEIPLFAVSGYCNDPIMADPCSFGFTDSLSKPFKLDELQLLLSHYLSDTVSCI